MPSSPPNFTVRTGARRSQRRGSFYDFVSERLIGTARRTLTEPPDAWGGRAGAEWVRSLQGKAGFATSTTGLLDTAGVIDRLYGRTIEGD